MTEAHARTVLNTHQTVANYRYINYDSDLGGGYSVKTTGPDGCFLGGRKKRSVKNNTMFENSGLCVIKHAKNN